MTPEEVLTLAERAAKPACKEALFSLGESTRKNFPEARESPHSGLSAHAGLSGRHVRARLEKTGLLAHAIRRNGRPALERLKNSNASVGLMLENVSPR